MVVKKKKIEDTIKELPAIMAENKTESFKPFIEKGKVFQSQVNTKWSINVKAIPVFMAFTVSWIIPIFCLVDESLNSVNLWYNWKFKNSCICPEIFLRGEKVYGYER